MISSGMLTARALAGAWRPFPPAPGLTSDELASVAASLTAWGAGALAWWKQRPAQSGSAVEAQLLATYRRQALQDALREREVIRVVALLRAAGVEPILLKGWAIARCYAQPGLRPYGDIDLCVRPEEQARAAAILAEPAARDLYVDLDHRAFARLDRAGWDDLYARSRLMPLGDGTVRVLGPEDQLAFLCIHFLHHGGWRPLWLCDIAAALESRPDDFNWKLCLGPDRRRAERIVSALGLAHRLLGARLEGTPVAHAAERLPSWLIPAVMSQWEQAPAAHYTPAPIRTALSHPRELQHALGRRWPDPIRATMRLNAPFNTMPRPPFQAACFLLQLAMRITRIASDPMTTRVCALRRNRSIRQAQTRGARP